MFESHFYHRLKRKYVSLFGSIFNDMTYIKYNSDFTQEIERIKIPIAYAPKEKFMVRLAQDPDLTRSIQVSLPRMSFECTNMMYDTTRAQIKNLKMPNTVGLRNTQYIGVPYDLTFELNIFVKNIDDGNQIVEQILPKFTPDYTPSVNLIPSMGYTKDIPIILTDMSENIDYEGDFETFRTVVWTLVFTMKAYFFGPVNDAKIIRKVYANTYLDPSIVAGYITKMNVTGNGTFKMEDVAYQGPSISTATAAGIVMHFDDTNNILKLGAVQGQFQVGETIRGASTNAAYTLTSFDATPRQLVSIIVEPDSINADPEDDYGYSVTITEY